jgi:hypothetical protein
MIETSWGISADVLAGTPGFSWITGGGHVPLTLMVPLRRLGGPEKSLLQVLALMAMMGV